MLPAVLLLTAAYLIYLIWEKWANDRALASFQHVIHVNGIRGKTSVCRLIDAHLRGAGYRVFTKTTGSTPVYIDTAGEEHVIRRFGPAYIGEQMAMIRRASREGAQILILECMAVQPELQEVAQKQIVKGDLNVITNVRYDHVFEMGDSLDQIAASLAATVPTGGVLFTADEAYFPFFQEICEKQRSQAVLCTAGPWAGGENEALACAVGEYLEIPAETFPDHAGAYQEDFGASRLYPREGRGGFLNLFSANDPQSTRMLLERMAPEEQERVYLYNSRADRPDRLLLFIDHFFPEVPAGRILVMGDGRAVACRLLRRAGYAPQAVKTWREALERAGSSLVVGVGNIKGQAYEMIEEFEGGRRK